MVNLIVCHPPLTLFPTAYPFPLCYGGGCFSPPQLKTYLRVIDSNFFIHTNKTSQNKKKIKFFSKMAEKSNF